MQAQKQQSLKELHLFHLPVQGVLSTLDDPLLFNFVLVKIPPVTLSGRLMKETDIDIWKISSEKNQIWRRTPSSIARRLRLQPLSPEAAAARSVTCLA